MFQKFLVGSVLLHIFFLIGAGFCLPPIPVFEDKPVYFEVETVQPAGESPEKAQTITTSSGGAKTHRIGLPQIKGKNGVNEKRQERKETENTPSDQPALPPGDEVKPEKTESKPYIKLDSSSEAPAGVTTGTAEKNQNKNSTSDKEQFDSTAGSHTGTCNPGQEISGQKSDTVPDKGAGNGTINITAQNVTQSHNKSNGSSGETGGTKQLLTTRPPVKLFCPNPVYPEKARQKNWEGVVGLQIIVKSDGTVGEVVVLKSSNYSILDQEAEKTVKTWRYQPALKDGVPTECILKIKFPFKLED